MIDLPVTLYDSCTDEEGKAMKKVMCVLCVMVAALLTEAKSCFKKLCVIIGLVLAIVLPLDSPARNFPLQYEIIKPMPLEPVKGKKIRFLPDNEDYKSCGKKVEVEVEKATEKESFKKKKPVEKEIVTKIVKLEKGYLENKDAIIGDNTKEFGVEIGLEGETVYCQSTPHDIGFYDELDLAKPLVGHPVWSTPNMRLRKYNLKNCEKVTVTKADFSKKGRNGIELTIEKANKETFLWEGRFLAIGGAAPVIFYSDFFEYQWLDEDPFTNPPINKRDRELIENQNIAIGWSKYLVVLSLGYPGDVNTYV
jgi:hypothetical protein